MVVLVLVATVTVFSVPDVVAPIKTPSLDWITEDTTLRYIASNATQDYEFNVTVANVGADDVATFAYWHSENGTDLVYQQKNQSKNRTYTNWSGFKTSLFINETNVLEEEAQIGHANYTLTESTLENHVFSSSSTNWTFHYDKMDGYIKEAVFDNGTASVEISLIEEYTRSSPQEKVPLNHSGLVFSCGGFDHVREDSSQTQIGPSGELFGTTYSYVKVCWNDQNPDTGKCYTRQGALVGALNPAWFLFDYPYLVHINQHDGETQAFFNDELGNDPLKDKDHFYTGAYDHWIPFDVKSESDAFIHLDCYPDDQAGSEEGFICS